MSEAPIFTMSIPPGLRTNGSLVSGTLSLNLGLVEEKGVEKVRVALRVEVHT
jgi:hypothetical protein